MSIRRSNASDGFSLAPFRDQFEHDYPFSFPRPSSALPFPFGNTTFFNARVDWKETPEAHVFKVDLPGIKKEEVKVEILPVEDRHGSDLQISGERTRENEENAGTWYRAERSSGKFFRRFQLPENAKTDQIKASMENGVLIVTVPKEKVKKPEVKSVEISG